MELGKLYLIYVLKGMWELEKTQSKSYCGNSWFGDYFKNIAFLYHTYSLSKQRRIRLSFKLIGIEKTI